MKLINAGTFNGDKDSLPHEEHKEGAVMFKEISDMKKLSIVINLASVVIVMPLIVFVALHNQGSLIGFAIGAVLPIVAFIPHEILHAICFKETVYYYQNLKQGMLFVVGTETMSKSRFIMMSLCPNLILGFLPFLLFIIFPQLSFLGIFGAISISMGAGDYYNVFNALTQMPKGARTYLYKMNSYWYMP